MVNIEGWASVQVSEVASLLEVGLEEEDSPPQSRMNTVLESVEDWAEGCRKRSFKSGSKRALLRNMGSGVGGAILAMVIAEISAQYKFSTVRKLDLGSKVTMMSMVPLHMSMLPGTALVD